jgi:hypothetical protein
MRFYIDTNGLSMGTGDDFYPFYQRLDGTSGGVTTLWQIQWFESGADYDLQLTGKDDANVSKDLTLTALSDAQHYIEIYCKRATSDVAADGILQGWIDGVEIGGGFSNIDNYDIFPTTDTMRIGLTSADATTSGTFYLDDIICNDTSTPIGPAGGGALEINVTPSDIAYYTRGIRIK